jgi:hypothetical protein
VARKNQSPLKPRAVLNQGNLATSKITKMILPKIILNPYLKTAKRIPTKFY